MKILGALNEIIKSYDMGLEVIDVNFQSARPPEEVKKMRLMMQLKHRKMNNVLFVKRKPMHREKEPIARGDAQRILEEATAYKDRIVLDAKGEMERLQRLLPEFKAAPDLLRERLYIQTMEKVMANTPKSKVLDGNNGNNLNCVTARANYGQKSVTSASSAVNSSPVLLHQNVKILIKLSRLPLYRFVKGRVPTNA